jgi:pimeloyl-ACP methyl ester carboxylesterase
MPLAQVNGINLYYEIHGTGFPLILIRGLGSNADHWYDQVPLFSTSYKTIIFDNRGIGRSDKPEMDYTVPLMAEDVIGLMDALQIPEAHILGGSLGGLIAQQVAIKYPERVRGLILGCTGCGGSHIVRHLDKDKHATPESMYGASQEAAEKAIRSLFTEETIERHPEVIQKYIDTSQKHPPDQTTLIRQRNAVQQFDSFDELPNIKATTLILTGRDDVLVPPENSRILAERIPDSRLEIIPGGGHQFLIERSDLVNRLVLDFLDGLNG